MTSMIDINKLLAKCAQAGKSATPQRISIIQSLSELNHSISAYDLLARLKSQGHGFNVSTIYRVLDFWIELGLVHKIESNNTYLVCSDSHEHQFHVLLHCTSCNSVQESCQASQQASFSGAKDFSPQLGQVIELKGVCQQCQ